MRACARCGLPIALQEDGLGLVWLAFEEPRAVCPASSDDDPVPRDIHHVPLVGSVETDDEVLLELMATMPPEVIERFRRIEEEEEAYRANLEGPPGSVRDLMRELFPSSHPNSASWHTHASAVDTT